MTHASPFGVCVGGLGEPAQAPSQRAAAAQAPSQGPSLEDVSDDEEMLPNIVAKKLLSYRKGRERIPLHSLGPALFNRQGAMTSGRHCHDLGKRILFKEAFAEFRYNEGWCHEPDPSDPLSVSRHGNAMASKDELLPVLPATPLFGVFAKTHLTTMLQLLKAGTHKWVDEDTLMQAPWLCEEGSKPKHPTTREQARSQSKESEYEELRKVLTDGIYMLVFPWSVVRDHREDITALMRDDSAPTKSGGSKPK